MKKQRWINKTATAVMGLALLAGPQFASARDNWSRNQGREQSYGSAYGSGYRSDQTYYQDSRYGGYSGYSGYSGYAGDGYSEGAYRNRGWDRNDRRSGYYNRGYSNQGYYGTSQRHDDDDDDGYRSHRR